MGLGVCDICELAKKRQKYGGRIRPAFGAIGRSSQEVNTGAPAVGALLWAVREWNAEAYHRVSEPQYAWGRAVLSRLPLSGRERVLDIGCGTGRLTADLLARLPEGRVECVDLSANMLEAARNQLSARFPGRVGFVQAEATRLPFRVAFDAVFSTATFHWVLDHDALFASVFDALVPGGRLVAQSGAARNIARFHARCTAIMRTPPFDAYFGEWNEVWEFVDPPVTERRLREAGFDDVRAYDEDTPIVLADAVAFKAFIATAVVRRHLTLLPTAQLQAGFLDALAAEAAQDTPAFEIDYRRLNIEATRPR